MSSAYIHGWKEKTCLKPYLKLQQQEIVVEGTERNFLNFKKFKIFLKLFFSTLIKFLTLIKNSKKFPLVPSQP
jgi:hypothetical protein